MNIVGQYTSELTIEILFCNKHGETRHGLSGKKNPRWKCMECSSDFSYERKRMHKRKAIEYKGGACVNCGYNKSDAALHFHHVVKENKSFEIAQNLSRNWDSLKSELDKCILLCMNCHLEAHEKLDILERARRKEKMKPKKTYHRKELHYINAKKLGKLPIP